MEENIEQTINTQNYQSQDSLQSPIVVVKKKSILPYLLSLFVIISLAIAFYFYNQTQFLKNQLTVVASPSPIVEPKASANPYENWNTYTNSVHNVSFKYPLGWQLAKENDLAKYNASIKLTKDQATIHMIFGVDGIGGSGMDYEGSPFILDGNKVFKYKAHNTYDNSESVGITNSLTESLGVLLLNNKTYVINIKYPAKYIDSGESINLEKTFDQILSTFKFSIKESEASKSNQYQITNNNLDKNIFLTLPDSSKVSKNLVTINDATYQIGTAIGPGLCPMDTYGDSCKYTDSTTAIWQTYRVWTKNENPFAINPQTGLSEGVSMDGLIIKKTSPNTIFTESELKLWKSILDNPIAN